LEEAVRVFAEGDVECPFLDLALTEVEVGLDFVVVPASPAIAGKVNTTAANAMVTQRLRILVLMLITATAKKQKA
jgi:hypothetical protein